MTDKVPTPSAKTFWIAIFTLAALLGIVYNKTDNVATELSTYKTEIFQELKTQSSDISALKTDTSWIRSTLSSWETN